MVPVLRSSVNWNTAYIVRAPWARLMTPEPR